MQHHRIEKGLGSHKMEMQTEKNTNKDDLSILLRYRSAIMGFAALWIFIFHEWQRVWESVPIIHYAERFIKRIGFCGVDMFFLMSGIGLTYALQKGLLHYYRNRFKRIILPLVTIGLVNVIHDGMRWDSFFKNISGYNFWTNNIYSFLWFIPAITALYLIFPFYYRWYIKRQSKENTLACILMLWLIISIYFRECTRQDLYGFTNRIPIFLLGIYIGWRSQYKTTNFLSSTKLVMFCMLITGIYLSFLTNFRDYYLLVPCSNCFLPNILMSISISFFIAKILHYMQQSQSRKIGLSLNRSLSFFGAISLELYCLQEWFGATYHSVIENLTHSILWTNILIFVLATLISYAMHYLFTMFWSLIENKR